MRLSRYRNRSEKLRAIFGELPVRCGDCHTRFIARTWTLRELAYSRCPKCLRMDLSLWSREHFKPPIWSSLLLALGAKPYRCEYCRHNFVGFRPRKEKFSFRRWQKRGGETDSKPTEVRDSEPLEEK